MISMICMGRLRPALPATSEASDMLRRVDEVNRPPNRIRYNWPLHKDDWDKLPEEIYETDWQSRPLGHASKRSIPAITGVYMMCVRIPQASHFARPFTEMTTVIYVGKSKNLRNRYENHLNTPSPKVRAARETYADSLRFWFLGLPENRISEIEALLIDCFGPPANDQPGDAILVHAGPIVKA